VRTAAGGIVESALYVAVMVAFARAAGTLPGPPRVPRGWRGTGAVAGLWLVVAVPSLAQRVVPGLYGALDRDPSAVLDHRQWWRVVTAMAVQDGGLAGTAVNLLLLAVVLPVAVRVRGGGVAAALFLGCGAALNVVGVLAGAPSGGGNSGAAFALALGVAVRAWTAPGGDRPFGAVLLGRGLAAGCLLAAVALVALGDAHGIAMLAGAAAGAATDGAGRARRPRPTRPASTARVTA